MADPNASIPFLDWLGRYSGVIIVFALASIGGVLFAVTRMKNELYATVAYTYKTYKEAVDARLEDMHEELDDELKEYRHQLKNTNVALGLQVNRIVVLETTQQHTGDRLEEIKVITSYTNSKLAELSPRLHEAIVNALLAMRESGNGKHSA